MNKILSCASLAAALLVGAGTAAAGGQPGTLGVGAEARRVRSLGDPDLSEVSAGLRLRF